MIYLLVSESRYAPPHYNVVAPAGQTRLKFIGCRQGTCVIAGNRYLSILYWAVLGGLAANIIAKL